jgi:lipopolysaccharide transport protein LptA
MRRILVPMALAATALAVIAGAAPQPAATRQIKFSTPNGKTVIYHQKKLVVATGGVELTTAEGTLWADKMEGTYKDTAQGMELTTVEATGNVKVDLDWVGSDKRKRHIKAQADRGSYEAAERVIVLTGHVTGSAVEAEGQTTIDLKGNTVTLHLGESIYEVDGGPSEITFTAPEPAAEPPKK